MRSAGAVFCLALALAVLSLPGQSGAETKKAKTIDELAAMYDSSSCKECHARIYEDWQKSIHSRSIFGTGRTAATLKTTSINGFMEWPYSGVKKPEDVKVVHLMVCAKCHLPQLKDAEDSVAREIMKNVFDLSSPDEKVAAHAREQLEKVNINCLICHNRNAIIHKWADGYPQKDTVYGTRDGKHPHPTFTKLKKSFIMKESVLCGQCHGTGPNFEFDNPSQCATLYASYNMVYRAEGGNETCQECHMEKSGLGHNMQSYRSPEMQKMAVDFDVHADADIWRDGTVIVPQGEVRVHLRNKAGHGIPDG